MATPTASAKGKGKAASVPQTPPRRYEGGFSENISPPSTPSSKRKAKFLFLCGVHGVDDRRLFGNFLGISKAFQQIGVDEHSVTYWNCWPWAEYLETHDSIKFRRKTKTGWEPFYTLTKFSIENQNDAKFWEDRGPNTLAKDVLDFIVRLTNELSSDDIFTLFISSHGSKDSIKLGSVSLTRRAFFSAFKFKPGVKVNLILQAYHPGSIIDALCSAPLEGKYFHASARVEEKSTPTGVSPAATRRNSCFTGTFVGSMMQWYTRNQGRHSKRLVGIHIDEADTKGKSRAAITQHETDLELGLAAIDVLLSQYWEIPLYTSQRNRLHLPMIEAIPPKIATRQEREKPKTMPSSNAINNALHFLDIEFGLLTWCGDELPESDLGEHTAWISAKKAKSFQEKVDKTARCLRGMKKRFRAQEPFFLQYLEFVAAEIIMLQHSFLPMNLINFQPDWSDLFCDHLLYYSKAKEVCQSYCFPDPLFWLSVLTVRGNWTEPYRGLHKMHTALAQPVHFLGEFDSQQAISQHQMQRPKSFPFLKPEAIQTQEEYLHDLPCVYFWLPRGADGGVNGFVSSCKSALERYEEAENIYNDFFGDDAWERVPGGGWYGSQYIKDCLNDLIDALRGGDIENPDHWNNVFAEPIEDMILSKQMKRTSLD